MKSIAFVIDYPDYHGGAHVATFTLIDRLRSDGYLVDVVSPNIPQSGIRRQVFRIIKHLHIGCYPDWVLDSDRSIRRRLSKYDTVCCMGEPSISRKIVSGLPSHIRKVILIHTDYVSWRKLDSSSREHCRFDKYWYPKYDCIAIVGKNNAGKMAAFLPELKRKIQPFHNIIDNTKYKHIPSNTDSIKLISIIRVGSFAKQTERYVIAAKSLVAQGFNFDWKIYGDGDELEKYRQIVQQSGLSDNLHFEGYCSDLKSELCKADIMVLLSCYEGLPNAIYESFLCGTPVFSTNVGSISEQVIEGETGCLVQNDDKFINNRLIELLSKPSIIRILQEKLSNYEYDNDEIYSDFKTNILFLGKKTFDSQ